MGRAYGTYGGEEKCIQDFDEHEHLQTPGGGWKNNIKMNL
jgi:hypothetical protein